MRKFFPFFFVPNARISNMQQAHIILFLKAKEKSFYVCYLMKIQGNKCNRIKIKIFSLNSFWTLRWIVLICLSETFTPCEIVLQAIKFFLLNMKKRLIFKYIYNTFIKCYNGNKIWDEWFLLKVQRLNKSWKKIKMQWLKKIFCSVVL